MQNGMLSRTLSPVALHNFPGPLTFQVFYHILIYFATFSQNVHNIFVYFPLHMIYDMLSQRLTVHIMFAYIVLYVVFVRPSYKSIHCHAYYIFHATYTVCYAISLVQRSLMTYFVYSIWHIIGSWCYAILQVRRLSITLIHLLATTLRNILWSKLAAKKQLSDMLP